MARLIDADALKKAVNDKRVVGRFNTIMLIDEAPTLPNEYMRGFEAAKREYKRPHGKWISNCEAYYDGLNCSVCGEMLPHSDEYEYTTKYCPHCGAKMEVNNNG